MAYGKAVGFEQLRHLACKVKDRVGLFPRLSAGPLSLKVVYVQPFHVLFLHARAVSYTHLTLPTIVGV